MTPAPAVLVATYTRNLADALGVQLRAELAGPDIAHLVDVVNLDALADPILPEPPISPPLVSPSDAEARTAWQLAASGTDYDSDFLADEWLDVVLANGITEQATYLRVPRPGKGILLRIGPSASRCGP